MAKSTRYIICSFICLLIIINFPYIANAKVDENGSENIWATFEHDDYVQKDWGLGVLYSDDRNSLDTLKPPYRDWMDKTNKRTHDLDNKNYNEYTIRLGTGTDIRGWKFERVAWTTNNDFDSLSKVSEHDWNWFNPRTAYNLSLENYETATGRFWPPGYNDNKGVAKSFKYRRFFVTYFQRQNPRPKHVKNYVTISNENPYYDDGRGTLWINTNRNNDVNFRTLAVDKYQDSYGQLAQYEAMIEENRLNVNVNSMNGQWGDLEFKSNLKSGENKVDISGNLQSDIVKNKGVFWKGYSKDSRLAINNFYLNGFGSELSVKGQNGYDYNIRSFHKNKYGGECGEDNIYEHSKFAINSSSEENYEYLKVDNDAPKIDVEILKQNISDGVAYLRVNEISDDRSGIKYKKISVWPTKEGENRKREISIKTKNIDNYNQEVCELNVSDFNKYYGEYTFKIEAADNLGNKSEIIKTVTLIDPRPLNDTINIDNYNKIYFKGSKIPDKYKLYKENAYNYWVRPDEAITIYTDGYFNDKYEVFPDRTYLYLIKDGSFVENNIFSSYMDTSSKQLLGRNVENYIEEYYEDTFNNGYTFSKNNRNYISAKHRLSFKEQNNDYKLYQKTSFFYGRYIGNYNEYDKEYDSELKDTSLWIKVDKDPPIGKTKMKLDYKTLDLNIKLLDVKDVRSGLKKVWAEISYEDNKVIKEIYNSSINNFSNEITFNAYDDLKSEAVDVEVYAEDNVGNKTIIGKEKYDLFTLKAKIVPSNNESYNLDTPPTFEEGQEGILIIETTGEVEQLDIDFFQLNDMDNTLNRSIKLNPLEKYKETKEKFIIPLYCEDKEYDVSVIAHRKGTQKEVIPKLKVYDSVLNGIRTRVR